MGMIGRWIDAKCASEPDVMRRVLGMRFGDLGNYTEGDSCAGCLVGSYYLARGEGAVADDLVSIMDPANPLYADAEIGMEVAHLCYHYRSGRDRRPQSVIVRALKQRIRKSLGIAPVRPVETAAVR